MIWSWKDVKADKRRLDEAAGRDLAESRRKVRTVTEDVRDHQASTGLGSRIAELFADLDEPFDVPEPTDAARAAEFPE